MLNLEALHDVLPTEDEGLNALLGELLKMLGNVQRGSALPEGQPAAILGSITTHLSNTSLPDETARKVKKLVSQTQGIRPPEDPKANPGSGKPFRIDEDTEQP